MTKRTEIVNSLQKFLDEKWATKKTLTPIDEVQDFPFLCFSSFSEQRQHISDDVKYVWLDFDIKGYLQSNQDDCIIEADEFTQKVEEHLSNFKNSNVISLWVMSVATDEGVYSPYSLCEYEIRILYEI